MTSTLLTLWPERFPRIGLRAASRVPASSGPRLIWWLWITPMQFGGPFSLGGSQRAVVSWSCRCLDAADRG